MLQQHFMRLQMPDDQIGGMLFLGLPAVVVHRIDAWSPLAPSDSSQGSKDPRCFYNFPQVLQRATDVDAGDREGWKDLKDQKARAMDVVGRGGQINPSDEEIRKFLATVRPEIVAIVEGIDPVTSNNAHMVHSYTMDDIEYNQTFAPCAFESEDDGTCEIDFTAFHNLVPVDSKIPEVQGG